MAELYPKKRIDIVVESTLAPDMMQMLEDQGAKGYTMISEVAGKGQRGIRNHGHVTDVFRNVLIITIVDEAMLDNILESANKLLVNYAGIVAVSDVEVMRDDHF